MANEVQELINQATDLKDRSLTATQRERREAVDRRNAAIQSVRLPKPSTGTWGGVAKGKP